MADIIPFPRWMRLDPIGFDSHEIHNIFIPYYFDIEVDWAKTNLGFWSLPMLEFIRGHRHREVSSYLDDRKDRRDYEITMKLYGRVGIENVKMLGGRAEYKKVMF